MLNKEWNMKKIVLYLAATACIGIGVGTAILFSSNTFPLMMGKGQNSYDGNEGKNAKIEGIREISIEASSSQVTLSSENRSDAKAQLRGQVSTNDEESKPQLEMYVEGNTLHIKEGRKRVINIGINISSNSDVDLDVVLPASYGNNIKITSAYGNVTMKEFKLNELNCNLSSGKLDMGNIAAHAVTCKNSYGNVTLKDIKSNQLDCKLNSGKLIIENVVPNTEGLATALKCENSYGNVTLKDVNLNQLDCKLNSGNLDMTNMVANTLNCENKYGDILGEKVSTKGTVIDSSSGKIRMNKFTGDLKAQASYGDVMIGYENFGNKVDIKSSSGKVNLSLPKPSEFSLNANASSGKINCSFPILMTGKKEEHSMGDKLEGTVGKGGNVIAINSSYGNIDISNE